MSNHKHHIIPIYKCIELGLTTSYKVDGIEFYFKENCLPTTRLVHADIHWGYYCGDLSTLLEHCNPPQWVIDMIPLGDNRDMWAAQLLAEGEIDGIDTSGENNPRWKGGITYDMKAYDAERNATPERKASVKAYQQTPEYKASVKAYRETPKYKAYKKEYMKEYNKTPKYKAYDKKRGQTPERKAYHKEYDKKYYAKKKTETQGVGTLKGFI